MKRRTGFILFAVALVACTSTAEPLKTPLTAVANIQLPKPPAEAGPPTLDLLTVDSRNGLLYVPYTNTLDVIDTHTRTVKGQVLNLPGIKSIALTPDPNIVFTANGGDNTAAVIDVGQLKVIDRIKTPKGNPDAMVYEPTNDLIVVAQSGPAPNVAFIDRATRKVTGSVNLPGGPQLVAVNTRSGHVFIAMHDQDEVIEIDTAARQTTATYKGCDIKSPVGIAVDVETGRLFVVNGVIHSANVVSVIDLLLDKCLGSIDIGHGPDQASLNTHLHHLYVANSGSTYVSVIDTVSLKPLGVNGTGRAAHSVTSDPSNDMVYVGAERAGIIGIYHDP